MRSTQEMYDVAAQYRGEILNDVCWMEKFIDQYIAKFFTKEEMKITMMHLLFLGDSRITLDNKKQIFIHLAKNFDLEWFNSYVSFRKHPEPKKAYTINNDLDYIIYNRNVLAHRIVDTTDEGRNDHDKIRFLTYKNVLDRVDFSNEKYSEMRFMLKDLTQFLVSRDLKWEK